MVEPPASQFGHGFTAPWSSCSSRGPGRGRGSPGDDTATGSLLRHSGSVNSPHRRTTSDAQPPATRWNRLGRPVRSAKF
jgi:hypothetical protein